MLPTSPRGNDVPDRPDGPDPDGDDHAAPGPLPHELWARMAPYERLYQRRILFLRGPIKETVADDLIAAMLALDAESDEDVTLHVDCPGGDTYGMFALHDTMQTMQSTVHTRCVGLAASAGGFLLATGTGTRSATPNARIMLHQPWGGVPRVAAIDLKTHAEQFRHTRTRMEEILAERTGHTPEQVHADLDRDHWLSADEALDYGIIDEVVRGRRDSSAA